MNYIIWNNKDSRDIKGLIICELPPITKPKMRVEETVIDGVNGSFIEELGYASYDKPLLVGITPQANIDEVIKFFSGQGDVVFSNEPDKFYRATIIGQIDYARLVRFRVATVTFRVQPFKYEYNEQAIILASKSINGKSISYKNNNSKLVQLSIDGNSTQEGTPTPDAHIEIKSIGYQNLCNITNVEGYIYSLHLPTSKSSNFVVEKLDSNKFSYSVTSTNYLIGLTNNIILKPNTTYKLSLKRSDNKANAYRNYIYDVANDGTYTLIKSDTNTGEISITFTTGSTGIIALGLGVGNNSNGATGTIENIMIEESSIAHSYIPYGKYGLDININNITKTIAIDEPLRSLPNGIKDIAHIKGNKLYVNRYVTSEILDGSKNWTEARMNELFVTHLFQIDLKNNLDNKNINVISSHFVGLNADTLWNNDVVGVAVNSNGFIQISCNLTTVDEFKTWLSENNIQVDYALETPITEEYDINSIFELVEGANVITNSESANMTMAYIDDKLLVTNTGNYVSNPIMTIKGYGTIEFILNGNKLFRYVFPEREDTVVIDSQKQDAYLGDVLKNRSMTGEFPTLEIGENIITWEGNVESIEISSKSRWL